MRTSLRRGMASAGRRTNTKVAIELPSCQITILVDFMPGVLHRTLRARFGQADASLVNSCISTCDHVGKGGVCPRMVASHTIRRAVAQFGLFAKKPNLGEAVARAN